MSLVFGDSQKQAGFCTGCGACENICPVDAIQMKPDEEGFLFPYVEKNICVECGLCDTVCDRVFKPSKKGVRRCYAVWASDEIREKSSSGGMFSLLAGYVLRESGYVCGAVFKDCTKVEHIIAEDQDGLERLRTSKYVQSRIGLAYREVKARLEEQRGPVLFSGTPCQVAGLYSYLGHDFENLYTVDVLCHGVPSQSLFDKYLSEEYSGEAVKKINFRDKCKGWTYKLMLKVETEKGMHISNIEEDSYYRAFNSGLSLRKSCGVCTFASIARRGDISLGDFWEIWQYDRSLDDRKGTSLVLINSEKGEKIYQKVERELKKTAEVPLEEAMRGNQTLYQSTPLHKNRQRFFDTLSKSSMSQVVEQNLEEKVHR